MKRAGRELVPAEDCGCTGWEEVKDQPGVEARTICRKHMDADEVSTFDGLIELPARPRRKGKR